MAEFQPGAAKHGNFINYYSFNPPERRIDLIPAASLINLKRDGDTKPRIILDVGCNAGVSKESTQLSLSVNTCRPQSGRRSDDATVTFGHCV